MVDIVTSWSKIVDNAKVYNQNDFMIIVNNIVKQVSKYFTLYIIPNTH